MSEPPAITATAAVPSAGTLYIATIKVDPDGRTRLVKKRSGEVQLVDRSGLSLRMFTAFLAGFLQERDIKRLTFVCSPDKGDFRSGSSSYKIESALQLLCDVIPLHSSALTSFVGRAGLGVPGPDHERLGPNASKVQKRAIYAAVYQIRAEADERRKQKAQASANEAVVKRAEAAETAREQERRRAVAEKSRLARERKQARQREAHEKRRRAAMLRDQEELLEPAKQRKTTPGKPERQQREAEAMLEQRRLRDLVELI